MSPLGLISYMKNTTSSGLSACVGSLEGWLQEPRGMGGQTFQLLYREQSWMC